MESNNFDTSGWYVYVVYQIVICKHQPTTWHWVFGIIAGYEFDRFSSNSDVSMWDDNVEGYSRIVESPGARDRCQYLDDCVENVDIDLVKNIKL